MGWLDDDLHPKLVGERTDYFYGTQAEVLALPITANGQLEAYAFFSVDPAENAAGFVYRMTGPFPAKDWYAHLAVQYAAGVSAEDAISRLRGAVSPDGVWEVATELRSAPDKDTLRAELNPSANGELRSTQNEPAASHASVDAVLRGEARSTREVDAAIANLDQAVSVRPTAEPLVVAMPRTLASLPADLQPGTLVTEPTFLRTVLSTRETAFPDAEAVLTLRIEPGTPAVFVEPENSGTPGTLLLGRGLTWEITGAVTELTPTAVFGRVVPTTTAVS